MTDRSETGPAAAAGGGIGRRRPPREWAWMAVAAAAVGGAGYAGWRHFARPVDARYQAVVDLLAADPAALPAKDQAGYLDLSGRFPGLTPRDEMIYVRRPDGLTLALFPTAYGAGVQLSGLLHVSRPLREDDTFLRQPTLGRAQRVITVAGYRTLALDTRIDEHWYEVSYQMH